MVCGEVNVVCAARNFINTKGCKKKRTNGQQEVGEAGQQAKVQRLLAFTKMLPSVCRPFCPQKGGRLLPQQSKATALFAILPNGSIPLD